MKYKDLLEKQYDYILNLRREFHMYPELSFKEYNTSKRIKEELEKIGIEYINLTETSVVGFIKGKGEKTVALRADMDALSIKEETNVKYKSKVENVMHACGHDGHIAMLLGASKALYEIKDQLNGNVKLIFQPAEELVKGAKKLIEKNVLEAVDGILGIHLWNDIPSGKINIEKGARMASGDYVKIDFLAKGGHGSMPHQTIDPIVIASSFIMNSQAILSREKDPLDPAVFTIGKLTSGTRFNVISDSAHLEGTFRCFNEDTRKRISKAITKYAKEIAESFKAKANVNIYKGTPATINDEKCSLIARESAKKNCW